MELRQVESPKWWPEFTVEDCSQHLLHLDTKKWILGIKEYEESGGTGGSDITNLLKDDKDATNLGDSEVGGSEVGLLQDNNSLSQQAGLHKGKVIFGQV